MTNLSPTFYRKLTYLRSFSVNNVILYKKIVLFQISYHTENRLNDIIFDNEKLLKIDYKLIINESLDANKAHGFDGISIRMLKLCNTSIIKPLSELPEI